MLQTAFGICSKYVVTHVLRLERQRIQVSIPEGVIEDHASEVANGGQANAVITQLKELTALPETICGHLLGFGLYLRRRSVEAAKAPTEEPKATVETSRVIYGTALNLMHSAIARGYFSSEELTLHRDGRLGGPARLIPALVCESLPGGYAPLEQFNELLARTCRYRTAISASFKAYWKESKIRLQHRAQQEFTQFASVVRKSHSSTKLQPPSFHWPWKSQAPAPEMEFAV